MGRNHLHLNGGGFACTFNKNREEKQCKYAQWLLQVIWMMLGEHQLELEGRQLQQQDEKW